MKRLARRCIPQRRQSGGNRNSLDDRRGAHSGNSMRRHSRSFVFSAAALILLTCVLWGCVGLRSELYREETAHRYQAACKQYKGGDYEAARSGFESVIALDSDYGPAHAALGNLALIREDYPGALAHYRAAVAADPELEADLQPLILVALAHKARAPLQKAGVTLGRIYPLIMADRTVDVEALLEKDIPLQLLARDTMGITPGKLNEMQAKIAETADPMKGAARYRLFLGYLLFFGETEDTLAAVLVESAVSQAMKKDQQQAFVVLGQLYERQSKLNAAVDALLAAVDAGLPLAEVAHHLARIYRVDIESIRSPQDTSAGDMAPPEPMRIEVATHLSPPPGLDLGAVSEPRDVQPTVSTGSRNTF